MTIQKQTEGATVTDGQRKNLKFNEKFMLIPKDLN